MSNATTDQNQSAVPAKDVDQSAAETTSANDAPKTENSQDSETSRENTQQTGPGPKVLRSHYRGMPRQWEKNLHPKKDDE